MNIRPKVILSIAAIFALLGAAEIVVERQIILPSFAELERSDARTAMRRIQSAFDMTLDRIALSAIDWGNWADVYRFMQDRDPSAVNVDMTNSAIREIGVNLVLITDLEGNVVFSRAVDLGSPGPLDLDLAARRSLPADFPWRTNLKSAQPAKGLLATNRGTLMLAAAPVLDGDDHGPSRGLLILGRLLQGAEIERMAAQAQASLAVLPPSTPAARDDRLTQSGTLTHIARDVPDIFGHPILTLRVDVPREITAHGHRAVVYALAWQGIAAVFVLILLVAMLSRVVLNPLAAVTRHAVAVGVDDGPQRRLALERKDEIGVLARELDRMVERLAQSHRELVVQSFEAGFAELARGVLHNLGNAMTPIGVRLANLATRLRDSSAADAARAAAELKGGAVDAERRADLVQFLHLACQDLAGSLLAAQEDVAVMTRQTKVVQNALTEQMRAARNEHVIEPVQLTELVSQSLDIVPDRCRQRLSVDTGNLRSLGVVRVARTVLRLVLQNLIINAAEAVRDAGKDKGTLRFSAEILQDEEREKLHLQCADDGAGISAQNLARIFDKGFSTKSSETNHGIGLHWCANVIGALGGRIWAASDGPGHGASMHLLVPLAGRQTASLAGAA